MKKCMSNTSSPATANTSSPAIANTSSPATDNGMKERVACTMCPKLFNKVTNLHCHENIIHTNNMRIKFQNKHM